MQEPDEHSKSTVKPEEPETFYSNPHVRREGEQRTISLPS